jgi:FKBP12-rapamycin complex-associated protein
MSVQKYLKYVFLLLKVLPELFRAVRMCEDGGLKEFITWKLGTLISIVRQVISPFQCC